MGTTPAPGLVRFGIFELDVRAGELRRQGRRLRLSGQPVEILASLVERPGEVVTRDELRSRLWPTDTFVDFDHSLNAAVNKLREALGDEAASPRFIETLPRRGYRFLVPVEQVGRDAAADAAAAPPVAIEPRPGSGAGHRRNLLLAAGAGAVVVLAGLLAFRGDGSRRLDGRPASAPARSLAVLPFANLSNDAEQEHFADGFTEELISQLARVGSLRVISRTSVMQYKNARKPLSQIAAELNVDVVVEGSVQRSGDRIRISAQLLDARSDRHLWTQTYEKDLRDILGLQSAVARDVASRVRARLTPAEATRLASTRTVDPEVYQLYSQARFYDNKSLGWATQRALDLYQQAVARDPEFLPAHVGIANAGIFGFPPRTTMASAEAAAIRALELDAESSDAQAAMATVQLFWRWDWEGSERSFKRALELDPNSTLAHYRYAHLLLALGRFGEAAAECERALALDPLSPEIGVYLGRVHYFRRDFPRAEEQLQKVVSQHPDNYWAHLFLSFVYDHRGKPDLAVRERVAALTRSTDRPKPETVAALLAAYRTSGAPAVQRLMLDVMTKAHGPDVALVSSAEAIEFARLGDKERALEWLARAFASHTRDLIYINVQPEYDGIRADPRFRELVRRMRFPAAPPS